MPTKSSSFAPDAGIYDGEYLKSGLGFQAHAVGGAPANAGSTKNVTYHWNPTVGRRKPIQFTASGRQKQTLILGTPRSIFQSSGHAQSEFIGAKSESDSSLMFGKARTLSYYFGSGDDAINASPLPEQATQDAKDAAVNPHTILEGSSNPFDIAQESAIDRGLNVLSDYYGQSFIHSTPAQRRDFFGMVTIPEGSLPEDSGLSGFFSNIASGFKRAFRAPPAIRRAFTHTFTSSKSFAVQSARTLEVAAPAVIAGAAMGGVPGLIAGGVIGVTKGALTVANNAPRGRALYQSAILGASAGGVAGYAYGQGIASYIPGSGFLNPKPIPTPAAISAVTQSTAYPSGFVGPIQSAASGAPAAGSALLSAASTAVGTGLSFAALRLVTGGGVMGPGYGTPGYGVLAPGQDGGTGYSGTGAGGSPGSGQGGSGGAPGSPGSGGSSGDMGQGAGQGIPVGGASGDGSYSDQGQAPIQAGMNKWVAIGLGGAVLYAVLNSKKRKK